MEIKGERFDNKLIIVSPTAIAIGSTEFHGLDTKLVGRVKALLEENEKLIQMRADVIEHVRDEQTEERFVGGTCDGEKYYVLYHSDYLLTLLEAEDGN